MILLSSELQLHKCRVTVHLNLLFVGICVVVGVFWGKPPSVTLDVKIRHFRF